MNASPGDDQNRAQIFKPKSGSRSYELGGHGGASAARPHPSAPQPAAKPTPQPPSLAMPTPTTPMQAQGQALAETVVSAMIARMTQLAEAKGGTLSIEDIRNLGQQFQSQTVALSTVFEKTLEQSVKAAHSQTWDQARKTPFDRIMVKTFSHLFADGTQLKDEKKGLSRRMLPGFFIALNMMLGEEQVNALQDRCRDILDRIREQKGGLFNWEHFYQDAEAEAVVTDALITIAMYFENLGRRETWFIDLVNQNLAPPSDPKSAAAMWQLTSPAFYRLLDAIFSGVRQQLAGGKRAGIVQRHDKEKVVKLEGILNIIKTKT